MDSSVQVAIVNAVLPPVVGLIVWMIRRWWTKADREAKLAARSADATRPVGQLDGSTPAPAPVGGGLRGARLVSQSMYFLWWPIWMLAFICAGISYAANDRIVVVPGGTKLEPAPGTAEFRLVLPVE